MESIERYEQKYLLSLSQVAKVKRLIRPFVQEDKNSLNGPYTVLSLYLDGVDRPFYKATQDQISERLKLRIRTYGTESIFLEIKRKMRGMIWKSRVRLNYHTYRVLFLPRLQSVSRAYRQSLIEKLSNDQRQTLNEFLWWQDRYQASPHYWVGYEREGFESPDGDYARVTFDYRVKGNSAHDYTITPELVNEYHDSWKRVDYATQLKGKQADVIMELKSEHRVPSWMSTLTQMLNLSVVGVSKYVLTVDSSDTISQSYRNNIQTQSVNK